MSEAADVVRSFLDALSGDDPDRVALHVVDGFRNEHLSALGSGSAGRDEYRRRLPDFMANFPERRYEIDRLIETADGTTTEVVVRYRFEASYGGHRVSVPGLVWFGVEDGSIVSRVDAWDSLSFLRQTGQA